jgi:hypothetical protein
MKRIILITPLALLLFTMGYFAITETITFVIWVVVSSLVLVFNHNAKTLN